MLNGFRIVENIPKPLIPQAAAIYYEAFEAKLGGILKRDGTAERFFATIMKPEFAVFAVSNDEANVLGVAGSRPKAVPSLKADYAIFSGIMAFLVAGGGP